MDDLANKIKMINEISVKVYKNSGDTLIPNIMIKGEGFLYQFMFPTMGDNVTKNDIAYIAIGVGSLLSGVEYIAFNSEAWTMEISQDNEPEIYKKYKNDRAGLSRAIRDKYPTIENCPHKKEMLVTMICDGENSGVSNSEIIRNGDNKVTDINVNDRVMPIVKSTLNPYERFNGLLAKANHFKMIIDCYRQDLGKEYPIDDLEFIERYFTYESERYNLGLDVANCVNNIKNILGDIDYKDQHTVH